MQKVFAQPLQYLCNFFFSHSFCSCFTENLLKLLWLISFIGLFRFINDHYSFFHYNYIKRIHSQLSIHLLNIFASTSQDGNVIAYYMMVIFLSEVLIDSIKHFFITRLNRLRSDLYTDFKDQNFKDFHSRCTGEPFDQSEDEEVKGAYKLYNASLLDRVFEPESSMGMAGNLLILPQVCLILRNIVEFIGKRRISHWWRLIGLAALVGLIMRYTIKWVLLHKGQLKKLRKAIKIN